MKPTFDPILAGVQMRITDNPDEAWAIIDQLEKCCNCQAYTPIDLFHGRCDFPEDDDYSFEVGGHRKCECFWAKDKRITYWIHKLVTMAQDADGQADQCRAFFKNYRDKQKAS